MKIETKHVHLIGICGTAMASLAGMLQLEGHTVTGSDAAAYPPMSDFLDVGAIVTRYILQAVTDEKEVKAALDQAAAETTELLQSRGYYK